MANRYSRRRADGITEYADSVEQLAVGAAQEQDAAAAGCLTGVGLVLGLVGALIWLHYHGSGWPKILRFSLVIAMSAGCACLLRTWAQAILMLVGFAVALILLAGIVELIWGIL